MMVESSKGGHWDVTGKYKISCPYIEKEWYNNCKDGFNLQIFRQQTSNGLQMYAQCDFGIVKRVFRFERQASDKKAVVAGSSKKSGDKRKRDQYGNAFDDESDSDNPLLSPTPEAFYFGSTQNPPRKAPTWNYRWRGNEEGEGVISLYSDKKMYSLTFSGIGGTELAGTFGCDLVEDCEFTGKKVSMGGKSIDIGKEWADRNERAYERAETGRWH
jgi:hypothetical protein